MISGGCAYVYTTCRVGVISSEISKHSKISPPPSLRSHLTSSPMGVLSGDYGIWRWRVQSWILEHGELDRKRARPAILNVWRFGNPLKYSGLRAAPEVQRSVYACISDSSTPPRLRGVH